MSNPFRDQLKKAKLLSDKDAKRLAHEERQQRKNQSRSEAEAEQVEHRAQLERKRKEQRDRDRKQQAVRDVERRASEERAACRMLLDQAQSPGPGTTTFYFVTPDGAVPWIQVSAQQLNGLTNKSLRIVRAGPAGVHVYKLVPPQQAERIGALFPDAVV